MGYASGSFSTHDNDEKAGVDELHEDYDSVPTEGTLPEGASVVISEHDR